MEAEAWSEQTAHFGRSEIAGEEDWFPDRRGALDSHDVGHLQFHHFSAEAAVGSIAGISQHYAWRDTSLTCTPDLIESDFRLGLKLSRIRHSGLLSPLAVFNPRLRQVQTVCNWH